MLSERLSAGVHVPSVVPVLNPLIKRLIGAGLPFGPNILITIRGRKSGVARTFPIALLELGGRRYVQSPFGEVNWVHNLRAAREAIVQRNGIAEPVDALEVPTEQAGALYRDALAPYLRSRLWAPLAARLLHLSAGATPTEFVEHARKHPMFELRPRTA